MGYAAGVAAGAYLGMVMDQTNTCRPPVPRDQIPFSRRKMLWPKAVRDALTRSRQVGM